MIGSKQLQFGAAQFAPGQASSDYATDGAIGATAAFINPFITPGALYASPATDKSTNVNGAVIASAEDSQAVASLNRVWVTDNGHFQSYNGTSVTDRHTGSKTYTAGTTDMVNFAGYTWATSGTDVARWNTSGFTLIEDWWTNASYGNQSGLTSTNRHHLLVFENLLWVVDGGSIKTVNASLAITTSNWQPLSGELVTTTGVDPSTGLMMVAVTVANNYSDTLPTRNFVYLYDGYSTKPRRKIPVDDMVTGFRNVGGVVYCGYGTRVGVWNGNGISLLRKLTNVTYAGADLPYKNHFSSHGNFLLVIDGIDVLAYGEVTPGSGKGWFKIARNDASSAKLQHVCTLGSAAIGISYATSQFFSIDLASGGGSFAFKTTYVPFERPVFIRRVRVFTSGITTNSNVGAVSINAEAGNIFLPASGATRSFYVTAAQSPKYVFDFDFTSAKLQSMQLVISFDTQSVGLYRVIVYYDPAE